MMFGTPKGRAFILTGCLVIFFCLAWGGALERGKGTANSEPSYVISLCILPFYTSTSRPYWNDDLAPLLEADLAKHPWLKLIPSRTVYEVCYEVQPPPWLVRGFWERDCTLTDAEVFVGLRQRLLPRVSSRLPADYYVWGRVVSTGARKSIVVEVTEDRIRREPVLRSAKQAETEEAIPEALEQVAYEIVAFLEPGWLVRNLEETRKQYLAQLVSLDSAVKKAEEQVNAHPEILALRVLLLSLYEENEEDYGNRAGEAAAVVIRVWDASDKDVTGLADKLGVDPFLVLCRQQAKANDWSGVLETCRLGKEKVPLHSAEFDEWRLRAQDQLDAKQQQKEGTEPRSTVEVAP
jgi:hypothetical protein